LNVLAFASLFRLYKCARIVFVVIIRHGAVSAKMTAHHENC
jgi:hypothetical protein